MSEENRELISAKLALVEAKAKQLRLDYEQRRLWEGDLARGIGMIHGQVAELQSLVRFDQKE